MSENKQATVVMIGAGPTSLAAAVYTSREHLDTVMLEKGVIGGLAAITDKIDNYPGFENGVEGMELAMKLQQQAERFGAKIELAEVSGLKSNEDGTIAVDTSEGEYKASAVLIGTGSDWKKINVPGEEEYFGRGVHYCATCDGAFYKDKRLVVVGGGNSAAQEALFLTRFASHIDILIRSNWSATEVLVDEVEAHDNISVHKGVTTEEIVGDENDQVVKVVGKNKESGELIDFETDGVFIFVGLLPNTGFLQGIEGLEFDDVGFIKTDPNLQTGIPGVFAAGDVRSGATMQIASAVGEGATAALKIREYLEEKERAEKS
jgi:thioredoxin reductase (NADPH)